MYDPFEISRLAASAARSGAPDVATALERRVQGLLALPWRDLARGLPDGRDPTTGGSLGPVVARPAPVVTFVVLTRDCAATVGRCLESLPTEADVVVVDSGSHDETLTVVGAVRGDARVVQRTWDDDFSAARNAGSAACRPGWVLHIDSDEWLAPGAWTVLGAALDVLDDHPEHQVVALALTVVDSTARLAAPIGRGLRAGGGVAWDGRVHERLRLRAGGEPRLVEIDAVVLHDGYGEGRGETKLARNRRLLDAQIEADPAEPLWRYYRGRDVVGGDRGPREEAELATAAAAAPSAAAWASRRLLLEMDLERGDVATAQERLAQWSVVDARDSPVTDLVGAVRYQQCLQALQDIARDVASTLRDPPEALTPAAHERLWELLGLVMLSARQPDRFVATASALQGRDAGRLLAGEARALQESLAALQAGPESPS